MSKTTLTITFDCNAPGQEHDPAAPNAVISGIVPDMVSIAGKLQANASVTAAGEHIDIDLGTQVVK